jgi:hypothetical protein
MMSADRHRVHAVQRDGHVRATVPLADLRRDRQPDVLPKHRDQHLRIGLLMRGNVALQQPALVG